MISFVITMLKLITLFSIVLATLASPTTAKCRESGWFGSNCQYKCHCDNGVQCDRTTGACPGKCERSWFGPACQYERIVFDDFDEMKGPPPRNSLLSDDQQTTCIGSPERAFINTWSYEVALTWLRIQGSSAEDLSGLKFSLLKGPVFSCRSAIVDSTTVDFFCHNAESSNLLAIWNPKKAVLCSVYISRGRNVALRQSATQSSTYQNWRADNAVDGKSAIEDGNETQVSTECSRTKYNTGEKEFWRVTFPVPVNIVGAEIHPWRGDFESSYDRLLNGFTLVAYDEDGKFVYHHSDTALEVISGTLEFPFERFISQPVKSVEIVKYKHAKVLSLCEVMLFGDSACPVGKFGRECERDCNCADRQDACFVSTGSCPSGCAPGYTGEGCWTLCDVGRHGSHCKHGCSIHCAGHNKTCSPFDGSCDHGCKVGYQPPLCDRVCDKGTYGPGCKQKCSVHCAGSPGTCSPVDGSCDQGCRVGYQPPLCDHERKMSHEADSLHPLCVENPCRKSGWFGNNCQYMCHCDNGVQCDGTTGACPGKCEQGWFGPACQYEGAEFQASHARNAWTWNTHSMLSALQDYDDSTCNDTLYTMNIELEEGFAGTWMRIVGENAEAISKIHVLSPKKSSLACRIAKVDSKTVDFFCPNAALTNQITLLNTELDTLCSIYIAKPCSPGTYGWGCSQNCSIHCAGPNSSCRHLDGACDGGCETGYQPPACVKESKGKTRSSAKRADSNSPDYSLWVWAGLSVAGAVIAVTIYSLIVKQ